MKKKQTKVGRPAKEPTTLIAVAIDQIHIVEKILNKTIEINQKARVNIRVPIAKASKIRKALAKGE